MKNFKNQTKKIANKNGRESYEDLAKRKAKFLNIPEDKIAQ